MSYKEYNETSRNIFIIDYYPSYIILNMNTCYAIFKNKQSNKLMKN